MSLATVLLLASVAYSGGGSAEAGRLLDRYPKNHDIDVVHYRFSLELSDSTEVIRGVAVVSARYLAPGRSLRLDLIETDDSVGGAGMIVDSVWSDRRPLSYRHAESALTIDFAHAVGAGQQVEVSVAYHGRPANGLRIGANRHGSRTFFSDNWPNRARHWLPTVDHPYDKATSEMRVTAPAHYQVVSNGLLAETTDRGDGRRTTVWRQSVPIATWLYALGVAEFAVQRLGLCDGIPVETWVAREDREAGFYDFAEPTCDVLRFYGKQIGPYSYEKLANVVATSVAGGMEAASSIFYHESSVTGRRERRWQLVIVHEIAHQWWGNAVTESDWDDVWLSEGFATYFTLLYREHASGRADFVDGLLDARERVREFYAKHPDYRVVHDNLADMSQVTTAMTYQKGAWVLHMLRTRIGTDAFWRGIVAYYRDHRDGNATTAEFRSAMERASGQALGGFFEQWLYRGGIPELTVAWRYDRGAGEAVVDATLTGSQRFSLEVPIDLVGADGRRQRVRLQVRPDAASVERVKLASAPVEVVVDPETELLARWTVRPE